MDKNQTFDVYAQLIILGIDFSTGTRYVMSTSDEEVVIPVVPWYREVGPDLKSIIDRHIQLDIAWINPKMTSVYVVDDKMYIAFAGQIPLDTGFKGAEWVGIEQVENPEIRPAILEAARLI